MSIIIRPREDHPVEPQDFYFTVDGLAVPAHMIHNKKIQRAVIAHGNKYPQMIVKLVSFTWGYSLVMKKPTGETIVQLTSNLILHLIDTICAPNNDDATAMLYIAIISALHSCAMTNGVRRQMIDYIEQKI